MAKPKPNGHLRQLRETPWLGWGFVAVLFAIIGALWTRMDNKNEMELKRLEVQLSENRRDIEAIKLSNASEKARLDRLQVDVQTFIGTSDRMEETLRKIEHQLIKTEAIDNYRKKIP